MPLFSYLTARMAALRAAYPISPVALILITLAYIFIASNATFWGIGAEVFSGHPLSFAGFVLAVFMLTFAFFALFSYPWLIKPWLAFMVILSAVTSYYMDRLGVIIDRDMIQNVMVTTVTESKHLITLSFVTHVVLFGVLPAAVLLCVRVKRYGGLRTAVQPVVLCALGLAMAAGLLMSDLKSYSSILRERKDYMSSFQPGMPVVSAIRYAKMQVRTKNIVLVDIGQDAAKGPAYVPGSKPVLTILVAGETARSQNFSLNGYGVETNPRLAQLPVVSFTDVSSCGTATATSLPCMFSKHTRDTYSYENGLSQQNLLDVLSHAGLHVEWWDNNTGDKNIADRIPKRTMTNTENAEFCAAGECMDGIFMAALEEYAAGITEDTVLVLHQIGSHGPTYYLRYPDEFEQFTPACRTAEFKLCSAQEIINAYDNTIAYTDEILAQTIAFLQAQEQLSTALLYVSDHGESLGEAGMYLHGSPYFMAPDYQTKVPMILWMSQEFKNEFGIDKGCVATKTDTALSHDNLFHSVLGMLDIETSERDPELDIFASCSNFEKVVRN